MALYIDRSILIIRLPPLLISTNILDVSVANWSNTKWAVSTARKQITTYYELRLEISSCLPIQDTRARVYQGKRSGAKQLDACIQAVL